MLDVLVVRDNMYEDAGALPVDLRAMTMMVGMSMSRVEVPLSVEPRRLLLTLLLSLSNMFVVLIWI